MATLIATRYLEWKGCQGGVQGRNLLDNPGTEGILFAVRGDRMLTYRYLAGIFN